MLKIGNKVLIRTITHYHVGMIEEIGPKFLYLSKASWVPNTGRFSTCLATGNLQEIEPIPDGQICINIDTIVDVFNWNHDLPTEVK